LAKNCRKAFGKNWFSYDWSSIRRSNISWLKKEFVSSETEVDYRVDYNTNKCFSNRDETGDIDR
jgi:hypothetical protein